MHYSNTANMAQSMLEGCSRKPALPTTEDDNVYDSQQPETAATATAASSMSAISTASAGGVVVSSTGPRGRKSALHSQEVLVIVPGKHDNSAGVEGSEAKQLAQQALERLKQEGSKDKGRNNSWPGGGLLTA